MASLEKAKKLWVYWDVRVLILLSLLIQVVLTFLAPFRKRSSNGVLKIILWLLYLSASVVALYVISQIAGNSDGIPDADLLAFWAPFLLLHLGGPDTITALALEDNELWVRHVLELITQFGVTLYVFINTVRQSDSWMWIPTSLMFIDGFFKYLERTQALYKASIDTFRESLESEPEQGHRYRKLLEVYYSFIRSNIPIVIRGRNDPSSNDTTVKEGHQIESESNGNHGQEVAPGDNASESNAIRRLEDELVIEAHRFYTKFKGLLADNFLSLKECNESRDVFMTKKGVDAVRMIEIELNFIYDVFYTKAFLVDSKQASLRMFSYVSVIASVVCFSILDKKNYKGVDVVITYILLGGALVLDVCAIMMLVLSDWYVIINYRRTESKVWQAHISTKLLKWFKHWRQPHLNRWCRSIFGYNLLRRCFKDPPFIYELGIIKRIKDGVIGLFYVSKETPNEEVVIKFIVDELQEKARLVDGDNNLKAIKEVCRSRGGLILDEEYCLISDYLKPWTTDIEYDESVLIWHIATDLCYHTCKSVNNEHKNISVSLSDYMVYLLIRQQTLVSTVVGMFDKRFADTSAEAKKIYVGKKLSSWSADIGNWILNLGYNYTCQEHKDRYFTKKKESYFLEHFCEYLLSIDSDIRQLAAKGDKSTSVIFKACGLAKQLKMLSVDKRWIIISKVWVELMCYAAVQSSPRSHIALLNRGGELITVVWLLMAHLGFGERFLQNQGLGWTKLITQK